MRILWVKAGKLLPVDTGGKIRSFNLLKQLRARHVTTLLSYYGGAVDKEYETEIERRMPGTVAVNTGEPVSTIGQSLHYLRGIHAKAPYAVRKFTSPSVRSLIERWDQERRFDVAICDFLSASLNFPQSVNTPAVLFQHNVESALWQRQARHEKNPIKRLVFKLEAAKMLRYERAAVRRFDHIIAVSENDRQLMSDMTDSSRISVVPTGVDLSEYAVVAGQEPTEAREPLVLFVGSMDWEANIDGVDYFCREIWPDVLMEVPGAKFRIVGRNPPARLKRLASDSVEVTGRVPSIVQHLHEAMVLVVPLRVGGGTRLKIFEAMAARKAVVSTTIGAEGLDVHDGQDILLADTPKAFAMSIVTLLRDAAKRKLLETAAARLAANNDWATITTRFEETLVQAMQRSGADLSLSPQVAPVSA